MVKVRNNHTRQIRPRLDKRHERRRRQSIIHRNISRLHKRRRAVTAGRDGRVGDGLDEGGERDGAGDSEVVHVGEEDAGGGEAGDWSITCEKSGKIETIHARGS